MKEEANLRKESNPKKLVGTVVSNKMTRTLVVAVESKKKHPKYQKFFKVRKKFKADCKDEKLFPEGSVVTIIECKPLSKEKRFRVLQREIGELTNQQ